MSNRTASASSPQEILHSLRRHWRKSILLFCVVLGGAVLITALTPREYRSEAKLFVRLGRENATLDPTATLGPNPIVAVPQSRENEINSVVEIIQSRAILEKVVDALGPSALLDGGSAAAGAPPIENAQGWTQQAGAKIGHLFASCKNVLHQFGSSAGLDDRQRAILLLAKHLKAEAAKKSNVVEVSYEGPSPELSQTIVNTLIDAYLDEHLRLNRTPGSHEFFAEQTRRLRNELSRKENELRELKNQTGLASPGAQRQLIVARIGKLEDDLLHAESARAVAQAKVAELRQKVASLPENEVTRETTGFGNEGTDKMREQFYALQIRAKEAQAKYTEDHPKMRQIRDQIAASQAILEAEESERKQITKEPGRLQQQAQLALLSEEPALASLDAQTKKLQSQLKEVRRELVVLNDSELRIAALQREVDLLEADYRKYSANLEQARIDQQLENQRMTNISIAQPASFEPRPTRPRKAMNLLLGLFAGVFGGLALPLVLDHFEEPPRPDRLTRRIRPARLARVPNISEEHAYHRRGRTPR